MPTSPSADAARRYFTLEQANKTLPLVRAIVGDIVRQFETVHELRQRLASVTHDRRKRSGSASASIPDFYGEELGQTQAELESEQEKLAAFVDELKQLGVELKGPDGLCDFPSEVDGREVCLCWKLGEPEILHWHEVDAGFAGRQPIATLPAPNAAARRRKSSLSS